MMSLAGKVFAATSQFAGHCFQKTNSSKHSRTAQSFGITGRLLTGLPRIVLPCIENTELSTTRCTKWGWGESVACRVSIAEKMNLTKSANGFQKSLTGLKNGNLPSKKPASAKLQLFLPRHQTTATGQRLKQSAYSSTGAKPRTVESNLIF